MIPAIECLEWKPLRYSLPNVDQNQQFFMKLRFEQASEYVLHMLVTDFKSVWDEKLRKREYIAKMKVLRCILAFNF